MENKIAKKVNKSPVIGDNGIDMKEGKARQGIEIVQAMLMPMEWKTPQLQEAEQRLQNFLNYCREKDLRIGNQMLYMACGISKDRIYEWGNGINGNKEQHEFSKRLKEICTVLREFYIIYGQINPITGIFWQKNYDGLVDKQEVVLAPKNTLGQQLSMEETKNLLGE